MKIDWKKAIGLTAAVAMLVPLAACGGSSDGGDKNASGSTEAVTLSVWAPQEDQAKDTNWLGKVEENFAKAHPEYNITWKNDVVSEGDASKQVSTDPSAAADVYMFASDQLGVLMDAKAIGQLGTDAEKQVKEQNGDLEVNSVTGTDGKLYGVPYTDNTWFMYYNKSKITEDEANALDERQSLNLIFLPGFSTMAQASSVSGRGVGMDVVKTNIQKLNGSVEIRSEPGKGSVFLISLPLTLAILPVLLVLLGDQPFALPLSMVREILPIEKDKMQEVGGKETLVVRGEVLPVVALSRLLGWPQLQTPEYGVLMQTAERSFILSVDSFAGRDDAVIKSLDDFRPRGVAGVTTLSNGQIVLILDMKELLTDLNAHIDRELGVRHNRALELTV